MKMIKMTNDQIDNLRLLKQTTDNEDLKGSYQHLRDLDFTSVDGSDAVILIQADFPHLHFFRDNKIGKDHEPIAIQSTLGWVLLGGKDNKQKHHIK